MIKYHESIEVKIKKFTFCKPKEAKTDYGNLWFKGYFLNLSKASGTNYRLHIHYTGL